MTILGDSVGANGCSPEEGEALSQAQGRRQKVASLLMQRTSRDDLHRRILLIMVHGPRRGANDSSNAGVTR